MLCDQTCSQMQVHIHIREPDIHTYTCNTYSEVRSASEPLYWPHIYGSIEIAFETSHEFQSTCQLVQHNHHTAAHDCIWISVSSVRHWL